MKRGKIDRGYATGAWGAARAEACHAMNPSRRAGR